MFGKLKTKLRSAEAAALVETVLEEMQGQGRFSGDPKHTAFLFVSKASDSQPHLFDGKNGHRPHRISHAAAALAMTVERAPMEGQVFPVAYDALGMIINGIEQALPTLPFSPQDLMLIEGAEGVLASFSTQRDAAR